MASIASSSTGSPLVSIVTPCLDPGDRLERCIRSVAGQTYPFVEHVVVDGGSSDGTVEALRRTTDTRWISEPDSGQSEAINKGFRMAAGAIVTWLNADDVLCPRAVELAVEALAGVGPEAWAYGDCKVVSGGKDVTLWRPASRLTATGLDAGEIPPQPGTFMSVCALERVGLLDESFHLAMDVDLWVRLVVAGVPSVYVPYTMSEFELHAESKSGSIAWPRFFEESARAFAHAGRPRGAAFWLGRGIAIGAFDGRRVDDVQLCSELARAARCPGNLPRRELWAGARAEAARLELPRTLRGLRHLATSELWMSTLARRRLTSGLRRGAARLSIRVRRRF
jgi:GT2 family glycosyltransferase